jgi:hypothetical protein
MRTNRNGILVLGLLLGACTLDTTPRAIEVKASAPDVSYLEDVKPVLDQRCVVCHSCFNAPCQLQLGSFEGIDRGASKAAVYSSSRLRPQEPTQLFMDAQTTAEWRQMGFASVLESAAEGDFNDSILIELLEAKRDQPVPTGEYHSEAADLTCPATRRELGGFLEQHPERGMPFGFPPLSEPEHAAIAVWLQQGAAGPTAEEQLALVTPSPEAARQISDWEAFLNQPDAKHAMTARYLYEHFFLAHVHFRGTEPSEFFQLVRSSTPPGEAIAVIATRRPYDPAGASPFFYRFRKIHSTIVYKTHMVVEFDAARLARFRELFIEPEWLETPHVVGLDDESGANPFLVYAQIPPDSRYRFLLDDAEYFIRTFIRGPVCKGQVALNVIHDHFWILFRDPAREQTLLRPEFLIDQAQNLALPNEQGSSERLIRTFSGAYRARYKKYYGAKTALYEETVPGGFGLEDLWRGRRPEDAPLLTVYRHFDSASVHRGALGNLPRTLWVIDYPQFERIYYALVAGFDVYGNVAHQVNVRRYMDFLRVEGELNFVEFLPPDQRLPTIHSWYLGDRAVQDIEAEDVLGDHGTKIAYATADPKRELVERVVEEHLLPSLGIDFDPINYQRSGEPPPMPTTFATEEDLLDGFRALTAPGTGFIRHVTDTNANVIFLRVKNHEGRDHFLTAVINRWHDNVNTMFGEEKRLDPSKDTIDFLKGSIGSYPNYFLEVEADELPELFDVLENFDGSDAYFERLHAFGVNRAEPHFWAAYDWFQAQLDKADPLRTGLYDLNRYYRVAERP